MSALGPCEIWPQAKSSNGYGVTWHNGKACSAHRRAWEKANGPIPKGLVVRHKCDVKACVRLSHLELGTPADNSRDMVERGRAGGGRPLTHPSDIGDVIRAMRAGGYHKGLIGDMLRVTRAFINGVLAGRLRSA